jgi:tRNA A37 threonylcarbamoyladenosine biosynthesis protein TsaE
MVILISGKQGSGKTTLSKTLLNFFELNNHKITSLKFAGPLYEMHDAVLIVLNQYQTALDLINNGNAINLDKTLLQILGTEWGREKLHNNIWPNIVLGQINNIRKNYPNTKIIIDDLRFLNELEVIDSSIDKCLKIRLECDEEIRKARCSQWRDNTNHPSETDLDAHLDKFDMVFDTGKMSVTDCVGGILGKIMSDSILDIKATLTTID